MTANPTLRHALLGSAAGLGAGLAHGAVEGLILAGRDLGPLFGGPDALVTGLAAAGVLSALGAALGALVALLHLAARRLLPARAARAALATSAALPVWLLNADLIGRQPLVGVALLAATVAVAAAAALLPLAARPWTRPALVAALLVGAATLYAGNALVLQGLYRPQHAALAYASLALTAWALALLLARRAALALGLLHAAGLALWLQAFVLLPGDLTQAQRGALFGRTVAATHALDALGHLADLDGDGAPALLGGGDCDDLDPAIHPGAVDVPDDGVDQDCLGGDATQAAIAALTDARALPLPPHAPGAPRPLLLITVDTLRADRAADMRSFQRLAARGLAFERAWAPYPSTILTVFGMLTGRAPSAIQTERVIRWDVPRADPSPTLTEALRDRGWRTAAVVFHHLFRPEWGLTRGFDDVWVDLSPGDRVVWGRSADETTDRAIAWLDRFARDDADRPWFLWVHYYDPHEPYVVHPETPPADRDDLVQLYDGEVRFTDLHLSRLLDRLERGGELERALVVLTADHGESLGEHGRRFHASAVTEEQLRVPLVVAAPGVAGGQTRRTPVSLQDLAATLSDLLAVPPPAGDQGATFAGLFAAPDPPAAADRPVFAEVHDAGRVQRAIVAWPWKLVHHVGDHRFELYDLERDPGERVDAYDLAPDVAARLRQRLGTWVAYVLAGSPGPNAGIPARKLLK